MPTLNIIFILSILLLGFGTKHYHGLYEEQLKVVSRLETEKAGFKTSAENCSSQTESLANEAKKRQEAAATALATASKLAKTNEVYAQHILSLEAKGRTESELCTEAMKLFVDYHKESGEKTSD